MDDRRDLLADVMRRTGTSQSELARVSGVRQPSISQFLGGGIEMSDAQVDRLLSCMGCRLEVTRRVVEPALTRSERRSWLLHRQLAGQFDESALVKWLPAIRRNLARLRQGVQGQPHVSNVERWAALVDEADLPGLHRVLTGLDRGSIEMREVSPMGGVLPESVRRATLREAG